MSDRSYVAIPNCFYCNQPKNEVILDRRLQSSLKHGMVIDKEPCDQCAEHMKRGIIFISVGDKEHGDNPYRTGGWIVITEEAVKRIGLRPPSLEAGVLKARVAFIPDEAWAYMGLPKYGQSVEEWEASL